MVSFARKADIAFFYRGRFFNPIRTAIGHLSRSPKIIYSSTTQSPLSGETSIDSINIESFGAPPSGNGHSFTLHDIFVGMKTRMPSGAKVPLNIDRNDLPKAVRKLLEETEKQHAFTFIIASFEVDPTLKNTLVNSVELRINKCTSGNTEEWLATLLFSRSRLYSFLDICRGYFAK